MTNQEFIYWMHGFYELNNSQPEIGEREKSIIKNHLDLVKTVDGYLCKENKAIFELVTNKI